MTLANQPHHDGSGLYVSHPEPVLGDTVTVWVRVPAAAEVGAVQVRATFDREPVVYAAEVDPDRTGACLGGYGPTDVWWRVSLRARNGVTNYRFRLTPAAGAPYWLTSAGVVEHEVTDDTDFRLVSYEPPPAWAARSVVYQIFPDRFARSAAAGPMDPGTLPDWALPADWDRDEAQGTGPGTAEQFYGGDLDGITEHLDHIRSVGADTVYLTPIFPGRSNHRYDASTFDAVDPLLGGDDALARLAKSVHERGMRLLGDITTNHTGAAHEWFRAALADPAAPERGMYYFHSDQPLPDHGYESFWDEPRLPKLDWSSPLVRDRMAAVLRRWLEHFDGWRVDVAHQTGRRAGQDDGHDVARTLRAALPADAVLLAEYTHDPTADMDRDGWHGTMNYLGFTRPVWTWLRGGDTELTAFFDMPGDVPRRPGTAAYATMRAFAGRVSWRTLLNSWTIVDSHDTPRIRTITGSRDRHLVAVGLLATYPGVPMLYAGSEFGLTGWNGENARTPMPWRRPDDRDEPTLAAYRQLMGLRAAEAALRDGGLRWLHADADTLVYLRETEAESLLVAARRDPGDPVPLPLELTPGTTLPPLYGPTELTVDADGAVTLPGDGPGFGVWRLA
ncbi:glycoside hydrolase family 13 protein [Catellatospora sp. KI3]|uniref:glycoside hydrolase family 13 protein n=1 Tax=Catellatospora sp. KI3 TaxID=3041620 RepID=UPI002482DA4D|nr:glycoside hydrolase family 13 protein [Catellatospora sp. KI3]MDI1459975.1 glycoside hydrolase family 13 protein [Catellatospora sp. KI3]